MKADTRIIVPHVGDPSGESAPVELPPYSLALQIETTSPDGFPLRYSVKVEEDGGLRVSCDGGRAQLEITNLSGNAATLRVRTR